MINDIVKKFDSRNLFQLLRTRKPQHGILPTNSQLKAGSAYWCAY